MTKLEILFVRACKSDNPKVRLRTLYRRFYAIPTEQSVDDIHLMHILANMVDKYCPIPTAEVILGLHPAKMWYYGEDGVRATSPDYGHSAYNRICVRFLTTKIRLMPIKAFPGFISPARFRNKS